MARLQLIVIVKRHINIFYNHKLTGPLKDYMTNSLIKSVLKLYPRLMKGCFLIKV